MSMGETWVVLGGGEGEQYNRGQKRYAGGLTRERGIFGMQKEGEGSRVYLRRWKVLFSAHESHQQCLGRVARRETLLVEEGQYPRDVQAHC